MEEKTKKVLLLCLQMVGDMGYGFQIEGMTQDKPEKNRK
jgi:hypothetical protein